jgi:hypothetical protein
VPGRERSRRLAAPRTQMQVRRRLVATITRTAAGLPRMTSFERKNDGTLDSLGAHQTATLAGILVSFGLHRGAALG